MAGTGLVTSKKCVTFTGLKGLSDEWDKVATLRCRMRDVGRLVVERPKPGEKLEAPQGSVCKTMDTARFNAEVLKPVLTKMSHVRHAVPDIVALSAEVELFHKAHGYEPCVKTVSDEAWGIRYLLGCIKGCLWKPKPPTEPRQSFL